MQCSGAEFIPEFMQFSAGQERLLKQENKGGARKLEQMAYRVRGQAEQFSEKMREASFSQSSWRRV